MRRFFILVLLLSLLPSKVALASGVGTITQMGLNNVAYAYQELQSEVIILQLGDDNISSLDQIGFEQLAATAQVGDKNRIQVLQYGQGDTTFSVQLGFTNTIDISQIKIHNDVNASLNDSFVYQSGWNNLINLLQLEDNNTTSLYQMDYNNEIIAIQDHWFSDEGKNALLVAQSGKNNLAHSTQIGAQQMASTLQLGNDNIARLNQLGAMNHIFLSQTGDYNKAVITQGYRWLSPVNQEGELSL